MRLRVQRDGAMRQSGNFIPHRIMADKRYRHLIFAFQQGHLRQRNFIAQLAVIINDRSGIVLPTHANSDHITCSGITAGCTANQRYHAVFNGVDYVIRRYRVDADLVGGKVINVHVVGVGGDRQVTRRIVRGNRDLHFHITVNRYAVVGKV